MVGSWFSPFVGFLLPCVSSFCVVRLVSCIGSLSSSVSIMICCVCAMGVGFSVCALCYSFLFSRCRHICLSMLVRSCGFSLFPHILHSHICVWVLKWSLSCFRLFLFSVLLYVSFCFYAFLGEVVFG